MKSFILQLDKNILYSAGPKYWLMLPVQFILLIFSNHLRYSLNPSVSTSWSVKEISF